MSTLRYSGDLVFQIREIELDANEIVLSEIVLARRFDGMDEARHEMAILLGLADDRGYEPGGGYWWAHNNDGKRFRYMIEVAD